MATHKNMMFVSRNAPHGAIYAQEGLEVVFIAAAFEQNVCLAFIDDGIYQLVAGQNTDLLQTKNFAKSFAALGDYDVQNFYVERESLLARGLDEQDLLPITYEDENEDYAEKSAIHVLPQKELAKIMTEQDVLFHF